MPHPARPGDGHRQQNRIEGTQRPNPPVLDGPPLFLHREQVTSPTGVHLTVRSESVQQVYSAYRADRYRVNRRYQRKLVWAVEEKQRLIDSIILALPLPLFLVAETGAAADAPLELIDGMQRLNAVFAFIEQEFDYKGEYFNLDTLADTKELKDTGKLDQRTPILSRQHSVSLANYYLALSVFRADDPSSIDEVFRRINSRGRRLSKQELRQAGTVSLLANTVRTIAATVRGDTSPEDIVPLRKMPLLSISNRDLKYGLNVEELFWVKQGIARREDVRESLDEQIILDILIDVLIEPMRTTNGKNRDLFYSFTPEVGDVDSEASVLIGNLIGAYGADRLTDDFLRVYDVLRHGIQAKPSSFAQQTGIQASGRGGRYFHALFIAVWEIMFKSDPMHRFEESSALSKKLENLAGVTVIPPGGDWTTQFKRQTIDAFKGILLPAALAVSSDDTEDVGRLSWIAQFETLLSNAQIEQRMFDCKQGFYNLSDRSRSFDTTCFDRIMRSLTAMSNCGPASTGYIVIGVADNEEDARRVRDLDGGELFVFRGFFVVGVDREARLRSEGVNEYWHWLSQKISSHQELTEEFRTSVAVEFRTVVDSSGGLRERVEQGVGDFRGEPCVSRYGCNSLLPQGSA